MDNSNDLKVLINSRTPIVVLQTVEEERAERIVAGIAEEMSLPLFTWTATRGLMRSGMANGIYQTREPAAALANIGASDLDAIYLLKDIHRYLDNPIVVRKLKDVSSEFRRHRRSIILLAPSVQLPPELIHTAALLRLELPSVTELKELVLRIIRAETGHRRIVSDLEPEDIERFAAGLRGLTLLEAERAMMRVILHDPRLTADDLTELLEAKKETIERDGVLEYCGQANSFEDVGGMERLKTWLAKRRDAFSERARAFGLDPPRGVLILGIQGCGKSLCAKAVAREWSLPLMKLDAGRLYAKYVGETESNFRQAISIAEAMAPVVLWIDELEKGFSAGLSAEADGGVSSRVLGGFVTWLQERPAPVFVVATSNDISSLPPELLRKGRFDEIFFVDLPSEAERREIFRIHLGKRKHDPGAFDLGALARETVGFSGADIEQVVVSSLYDAFSTGKPLGTDVLLTEIRNTRPLSQTMSEKISALRQWAEGRTVAAGAG